MAMERIDPSGNKRGDMQAGIIAQTVVQLLTGRNIPVDNFVLDFGTEAELVEVDQEALKNKALHLCLMMGGEYVANGVNR
jgi:hypothetical protein